MRVYEKKNITNDCEISKTRTHCSHSAMRNDQCTVDFSYEGEEYKGKEVMEAHGDIVRAEQFP